MGLGCGDVRDPEKLAVILFFLLFLIWRLACEELHDENGHKGRQGTYSKIALRY